MARKAIVKSCFPLLGLLMLSGCGPDTSGLPKTVPAEGVVLLDGTPVHGASIVFSPEPPLRYPARGLSDEKGHFEMTAFEVKSGVVPGIYKVMVSKTVEVADQAGGGPPEGSDEAAHAAEDPNAGMTWINEMPTEYSNVRTSGLVVTVPEDGTTEIKLELSAK